MSGTVKDNDLIVNFQAEHIPDMVHLVGVLKKRGITFNTVY
jgi:hypothetical protein